MSRILVAGLAVIDMVFEVERLPEHAHKYIAADAQMVGGGGGANAAVALARLQVQPILLTRVGDDFFGQTICRELHASGVDCSLVQKAGAGRSSFSSVLVDQHGERQIVNFRGRGLTEDVPAVSSLRVDAVLADTRWPQATAAVLGLAQQLGVPGVLDAEAPVPAEAVQLASHVAFSAQGLQSYTGIENIEDALLQVAAAVSGFVCVTDGANGVWFVIDGKIQRSQAYAVDAVDTLGAGDVWHAAFVCRLANGDAEVQAIGFANAAAALKCMRPGGGRMSPRLSDVQNFIDERGVC